MKTPKQLKDVDLRGLGFKDMKLKDKLPLPSHYRGHSCHDDSRDLMVAALVLAAVALGAALRRK